MAGKKRKNASSSGKNSGKGSRAGADTDADIGTDNADVAVAVANDEMTRGKKSGGGRSNSNSSSSTGIQQLTIYGVAVLVMAIVSGLMLNNNNNNNNNNNKIANNENESNDIGSSSNTFIKYTNNMTAVDKSFGNFWNTICGDDDDADDNIKKRSSDKAWCGDGRVEPTRRTLQTTTAATTTTRQQQQHSIRRGDALVEIPRGLQIWELDALRSDFVKTERLLKARHELTDNPLAGGAFLAVHLAHERKRLLKSSEAGTTKDNDDDDDDEQKEDVAATAATSSNTATGSDVDDDGETMEQQEQQLRASYFRSLPSWEELSDHHPILKSRSELRSMLGHHSWNFAVVVMYQEMIDSEYKALATTSPQGFGQQITVKEYQVARIHVLSRSFNPGPDACSAELDKYMMPIERERLQSDWGSRSIKSPKILFAEGCHAMVPILDMLNSHPHPNVVYKYHSEKQAFVISAKTNIPPQWELMDSYGKFSDAHLFAKFGFVNGDGSGHTQASIALFHRPLDVQISQEFTLIPHKITNGEDDESESSSSSSSSSPMDKIPDFQKLDLKRYLAYDDGYQNCVQKELHPEAFRLKQLKWLHLAKIANDPKSWIATLQPRAPESRPRESSDLLITELPPQVDPRKLRMDITHLVETCRLLALTVDDYEGNAIKVLDDNLGNDTFVVTKGSQALEYRSLMFLARMASTALLQYPVTLKKEYDNVLQLNKENAIFGNSSWTAAQLRLGEMQVRFCEFILVLYSSVFLSDRTAMLYQINYYQI